jgi:UDP-2,3-diacylglucosamine hydrolase
VSARIPAVFVSDVHLKGVDDARTRPFADFLRSWVGRTENLFIVGDLFDFYYGFKSVVYWEHLPALAAIDELVRDGIRVVFVEGNHEFRVAEAFRGAFHIETFESEGEVTVAGKRILLAHGDLADPKDRGYRFLHWALRNPLTAAIAGAVPPVFAMSLARLAADGSRAYAGGRGVRLTNLFREKARRAIGEGYDAVIFGHSHVPCVETISENGRTGTFANCGDWVENFTHLTFDGNAFTLGRSNRPEGATSPVPSAA